MYIVIKKCELARKDEYNIDSITSHTRRIEAELDAEAFTEYCNNYPMKSNVHIYTITESNTITLKKIEEILKETIYEKYDHTYKNN